MSRDYETMRAVLSIASTSEHPLGYGAFLAVQDEAALRRELSRLDADGLIGNGITFLNGGGACLGGEVSGLTAEGERFYRLIENDKVWRIVRKTLDAADVDVPYPLLREVCEEIVKRYVASFIPDIP